MNRRNFSKTLGMMVVGCFLSVGLHLNKIKAPVMPEKTEQVDHNFVGVKVTTYERFSKWTGANVEHAYLKTVHPVTPLIFFNRMKKYD